MQIQPVVPGKVTELFVELAYVLWVTMAILRCTPTLSQSVSPKIFKAMEDTQEEMKKHSIWTYWAEDPGI